ncbi:uncharacterized protein LOC128071318 [Budorcas taxicolor]|uniref:uncharacterized protein LOC128071318 n=1 Tax=Budorcas taxicolor TaxID=37181 RepID=UPI0022841885|nr:uncharacterized protein LOC128071318 [Budorcas taxicolor]
MSIDTLTILHSITCNETLVSAQKKFQLGFFSPGNSKKFYLGIWFNIVPIDIVWIANREHPLNDTCGVVRIGNDGNLILVEKTERMVWSTSVHNISSRRSTVAQLLDSGNLVLRDGNEEGTILWQSFDHPSHALLPGMKIGWDLWTGLSRNLTSWKDSDDPSPGEYTHGLDLQGLPQVTIWKAASKEFRSGPWNGVEFSDLTYLPNNIRFSTEVTVDSKEVYYELRLNDNSSLLKATISYTGVLQLSIRDNSSNAWNVMYELPPNYCGFYGYCGPNAVCTISDALICSCMIGYTPKNFQDWDDRIWSGGCIRENPFNCSETGLFKELQGLKMPDFLQYGVNTSMSLEECEAECSKNCSCTAYANANANATGAGHGCLLWFGDLIDVRKLTIHSNQKLHIRITAADLGNHYKKIGLGRRRFLVALSSPTPIGRPKTDGRENPCRYFIICYWQPNGDQNFTFRRHLVANDHHEATNYYAKYGIYFI